MTLIIITNYACISYDIDTELTMEEVSSHLSKGTCLFDLKTGNQVLVNPQNAVAIELKNTPLEEK